MIQFVLFKYYPTRIANNRHLIQEIIFFKNNITLQEKIHFLNVFYFHNKTVV